MPIRYDDDYYSWTQEQAAFLKQGRIDLLDLEHLADEVADLGNSEIREFGSRLAVIIGHLLKLTVQIDRTPTQEKSWRTTILVQRDDLADHLAKNPGLKNPGICEQALKRGWRDGLVLALRETGLDPDLFPAENPFTLDQLLDPDFRV